LKGGKTVDYVRMPELLSPEVVRTLAGNMGELRSVMEDRTDSSPCSSRDDICCPKKVKFILFLNNVVIINVNAVAEEDDHPHKPEKDC
jgi:hypothetical protein